MTVYCYCKYICTLQCGILQRGSSKLASSGVQHRLHGISYRTKKEWGILASQLPELISIFPSWYPSEWASSAPGHSARVACTFSILTCIPCGANPTEKQGLLTQLESTVLMWLGFTASETEGDLISTQILNCACRHTLYLG